MKLRDTIWLSSKGLREKKFRTTLTMLSVVIGVAGIIGLVSQTAGIQASVVSALQGLGPTSILISPRGILLTKADALKIGTIPGVEEVIPIVSERMNVRISGQEMGITLIGVDSEGLQTLLGGIKLVDGTIYPHTLSPLAVIGHNIAFPLSQGEAQTILVGQPLTLYEGSSQANTRVALQVVGLLAKYSATPFVPVDDSVFIPLDAAMKALNKQSYNLLLIRAASLQDVDSIAGYLVSLYGDGAQITTVQQVTQTASAIIGQFGILLGSIAAISLTVAGLGIMNIMLVSVFERTREIGILKAIGFKDKDILLIFLFEAAIIGAVGGLIGLMVGWGVSNVLPSIFMGIFSNRGQGGREGEGFALPSYSPIIPADIVLISLATAILISVLAGLYPASRASRMEPIKALKYE